VSFELNFDRMAEAERARVEAEEAVLRARVLVEKGRAFLLDPCRITENEQEERLIEVELVSAASEPVVATSASGEADQTVILKDAIDANLPPAVLPCQSA
jgi:hypothetical protein